VKGFQTSDWGAWPPGPLTTAPVNELEVYTVLFRRTLVFLGVIQRHGGRRRRRLLTAPIRLRTHARSPPIRRDRIGNRFSIGDSAVPATGTSPGCAVRLLASNQPATVQSTNAGRRGRLVSLVSEPVRPSNHLLDVPLVHVVAGCQRV